MAGSFLAAEAASAGGVGDFLSPAFGTDCANLHTGAQASGSTTRDTGAGGGNLLGLPIGSPLNQCGGADMPGQDAVQNGLVDLDHSPIVVLGSASNTEIAEN
ncbi:chaplin family protein [Streptomyces sp. NPDC059819]|uniref:chaplin family protein n=1 Tax=Streptomyces sp. NPDC059819 TaxID=3346963 RepID=UPI003663CDDB